jgi:hypothetical protein
MELLTSQITWRVTDVPLYLPHAISHDRLLAFLKMLREEGERGLGDFSPSVVNR